MTGLNGTRSLTVGPITTSTAHRLAYYDGVCGNIHGHNIEWNLTVQVETENTAKNNMPVDFKDISDIIDRYDHAVVLNSTDDPILEYLTNNLDMNIREARDLTEELLGDVIWHGSDPTCELLSEWVSREIVREFDPIVSVAIRVNETRKYGMEATSVENDDEVVTL